MASNDDIYRGIDDRSRDAMVKAMDEMTEFDTYHGTSAPIAPPNICTVAGPAANHRSFEHVADRLGDIGWLVFPAEVRRTSSQSGQFTRGGSAYLLKRLEKINISTLVYVCDLPSPCSSDDDAHIDNDTFAEIEYATEINVDILYQSSGRWPPRTPYDWHEFDRTVDNNALNTCNPLAVALYAKPANSHALISAMRVLDGR